MESQSGSDCDLEVDARMFQANVKVGSRVVLAGSECVNENLAASIGPVLCSDAGASAGKGVCLQAPCIELELVQYTSTGNSEREMRNEPAVVVPRFGWSMKEVEVSLNPTVLHVFYRLRGDLAVESRSTTDRAGHMQLVPIPQEHVANSAVVSKFMGVPINCNRFEILDSEELPMMLEDQKMTANGDLQDCVTKRGGEMEMAVEREPSVDLSISHCEENMICHEVIDTNSHLETERGAKNGFQEVKASGKWGDFSDSEKGNNSGRTRLSYSEIVLGEKKNVLGNEKVGTPPPRRKQRKHYSSMPKPMNTRSSPSNRKGMQSSDEHLYMEKLNLRRKYAKVLAQYDSSEWESATANEAMDFRYRDGQDFYDM